MSESSNLVSLSERTPNRPPAIGERLRITLAVAGFSQDQIEVAVEDNQLTIRGRQQEDKTREYLHRRASEPSPDRPV